MRLVDGCVFEKGFGFFIGKLKIDTCDENFMVSFEARMGLILREARVTLNKYYWIPQMVRLLLKQ